MLFKSGINLESSTIEFINKNNSITLFSPYLILKELEKINSLKRIAQIVVRWEIQDLYLGVSNFELYDYCKQHNIILYRNTRIHLKAFWNNKKNLILGSANVTQRGLGEIGEYNFELNTLVNNISPDDILYLYSIIQDSQLMTDELYQKIVDITSQIKIDPYTFPKFKSIKTESDYFLLSDLPMSESPDKLFSSYSNQSFLNDDEIAFSTHDFALYKIPKGLNQLEFMDYLNNKFNTHPFTIALKNEIRNSYRKSMNYGSVVEWIKNNTTTVPIPRSWDIKKKKIVNILYEWICFFDDEFSWSRPNHTQVLFYNNSSVSLDLSDFINSLRIDIRKGIKAPHQIILLAALYDLYAITKLKQFSISEVILTFNTLWANNSYKFYSNNINVGMPLRAFQRQNLIKIILKDNEQYITDYRNVNDLKLKIDSIILSNEIIKLFNNITKIDEIISYLNK